LELDDSVWVVGDLLQLQQTQVNVGRSHGHGYDVDASSLDQVGLYGGSRRVIGASVRDDDDDLLAVWAGRRGKHLLQRQLQRGGEVRRPPDVL